MVKTQTKKAACACGMRGRFYMWLASTGMELLCSRKHSSAKLGTFLSWRMGVSGGWFDFWRGKVWFADRKYAPCTHKHTKEKPCIYM